MPSSRARKLAVVLMCALPLASRAQAAPAAATPAKAVEEFMHALADSNLTRMAELWGTAKGPVSKTRPTGYEKRIIIMQAMMHGVEVKTLGDVPADKGGMRTVTTQLAHNGCRVTIPVNAVKTKEGWLVHDFDAVEASRINQPCSASKPGGNSP